VDEHQLFVLKKLETSFQVSLPLITKAQAWQMAGLKRMRRKISKRGKLRAPRKEVFVLHCKYSNVKR
jgi:hypothetical protein